MKWQRHVTPGDLNLDTPDETHRFGTSGDQTLLSQLRLGKSYFQFHTFAYIPLSVLAYVSLGSWALCFS